METLTPDILRNYQKQAASTAIYPDRLSNINYPLLGLVGEAGEICNKVKKVNRDHGGIINNEYRDLIRAEVGDVFWYIAALCDEMKADLSGIEIMKVRPLPVGHSPQAMLYNTALRIGYIAGTIAWGINFYCQDNKSVMEDFTKKISRLIREITLFCETYLECSVESILNQNISKLQDRADRQALRGFGDAR